MTHPYDSFNVEDLHTVDEGVIRELRQALGDSGQARAIIQTLHGHGYRFVAAVEERFRGFSGGAAQEASPAPVLPTAPALDRMGCHRQC